MLVPGTGIRYTVPVSIDTANLDENIHVRFRVGAVHKGVTIKISSGDKELASRKRTIVVPSEMEDIILKRSLLEDLEGDITVELTGGDL